MLRSALRVFIFPLCLISLCVFAQENRVIRVGVPTMKNQAGSSLSGDMERDRLVAALNHQKPDKKQHLAVQGVPLDGTTAEEVGAEAKEKQCDYVVYTTLTELQSSPGSAQPAPGTVGSNPPGSMPPTLPGGPQSNPNGPNVWNPNNPRGQTLGTAYRATVEYKLYRTGGAEAIAAAPLTNQQALPDEVVVSQVMDRIASRVFGEIKKIPPPVQ